MSRPIGRVLASRRPRAERRDRRAAIVGGSLAALMLGGCQTAQPGALTIWNRIPDTLLIDAGTAALIQVPPCTEMVVVPFPYDRYRLTTVDGRLLGWPTVDHDGVVVTVSGIFPPGRFTELPSCGAAVPA